MAPWGPSMFGTQDLPLLLLWGLGSAEQHLQSLSTVGTPAQPL